MHTQEEGKNGCLQTTLVPAAVRTSQTPEERLSVLQPSEIYVSFEAILKSGNSQRDFPLTGGSQLESLPSRRCLFLHCSQQLSEKYLGREMKGKLELHLESAFVRWSMSERRQSSENKLEGSAVSMNKSWDQNPVSYWVAHCLSGPLASCCKHYVKRPKVRTLLVKLLKSK